MGAGIAADPHYTIAFQSPWGYPAAGVARAGPEDPAVRRLRSVSRRAESPDPNRPKACPDRPDCARPKTECRSAGAFSLPGRQFKSPFRRRGNMRSRGMQCSHPAVGRAIEGRVAALISGPFESSQTLDFSSDFGFRCKNALMSGESRQEGIRCCSAAPVRKSVDECG